MATTTKVEFGDPRLPARFWRRVKKSTNGCWHWADGFITPQGYGQCSVGQGRQGLAHRHIYDQLVEPVHGRGHSDYRDVDHECHNRSKSCPGGKACLHRRCVNPAHLKAKEPRENIMASRQARANLRQVQTHCQRGHELVGDNLYVAPDGRRACYVCLRASNERRNPRKGTRPGPPLKTHCKHGHELTENNVYVEPSRPKARHCRACRQARLDARRTRTHH